MPAATRTPPVPWDTDGMRWQLRVAGTDEVRDGLSTEQIRLALSEGKLRPEEWASRDSGLTWQQISEIDEFSSVVSGSRRRRVRVEEDDDADMDMTPMIDVTFLLLIFFMVTASFHLQKGLNFPPSEQSRESTERSQSRGLSAFSDHLVIEIDARDRFSLKDVAAGDHAPGAFIAADRLVETLKLQSSQRKLKKVLVMAHENSSHEAVVLVIDAAGQAGIRDVGVADIKPRSGAVAPPAAGTRRVIRRP
jgi:biopolymer transport protein ExbD